MLFAVVIGIRRLRYDESLKSRETFIINLCNNQLATTAMAGLPDAPNLIIDLVSRDSSPQDLISGGHQDAGRESQTMSSVVPISTQGGWLRQMFGSSLFQPLPPPAAAAASASSQHQHMTRENKGKTAAGSKRKHPEAPSLKEDDAGIIEYKEEEDASEASLQKRCAVM